MKHFQFLLCFFLLTACQSDEIDLGLAKEYFPSSQLLKDGVVNKYYIHYQAADSRDISTHVVYRSYQAKSNVLYYNYYEPDFSLNIKKEFVFRDNQMLCLNELRFQEGIDRDTLKVTYANSVVKDWAAPKSESKKTVDYAWGKRTWHIFQEKKIDTLVLEKPATIFLGHQDVSTFWKGDTTKVRQSYKEIHVKDLGLFYQEISNEKGRNWMELVEQIPLDEFKKQAKHGLHRVAYIDPEKSLDKAKAFELCKVNNRIYDYYNGQQILHYKGGKKAIWKIVNQALDKQQLFNESGYLTFRFIVNCKGEAGRYVLEQADLDFQEKEFNKATITHFYQILQTAKDWVPTIIRGQEVDAYFYLTFKLKDGELIEILP
jgi:hypothetical protein